MSPNLGTPDRSRAARAGDTRTPYEILAARADRSRPFVTSYDGPQSCIELSVNSTLNAISKAAGLLRDELGLVAGDQLSVDLPVHWQLPVWTLAGLTAGLVVGMEVPGHVAVRIVGPSGLAGLEQGEAARADEILGCACDAFGMPLPGGAPVGVIDAGIAVRAHPDVFQAEPAAAARAGLIGVGDHPDAGLDAGADSGVESGGLRPWLRILADGPRDAEGARTWVTAEAIAAQGLGPQALLRRAAVDPVLCSGSVVLARHLSEVDALRARSAQGVAPTAPPS